MARSLELAEGFFREHYPELVRAEYRCPSGSKSAWSRVRASFILLYWRKSLSRPSTLPKSKPAARMFPVPGRSLEKHMVFLVGGSYGLHPSIKAP